MATILDELVIKLNLDSSGYRRDVSTTQTSLAQVGRAARSEGRALEEVLIKTQGETQKRMRQVEEVGRSAAQGFTKLRNEVVGLLGAIAGAAGLTQFARNVTNANTQLGYMAQAIGISTPDLDKWNEAGKRVGATSGEIAGSMKAVTEEMYHAQKFGKSEMMPFLRTLEAMPGRSLNLLDPVTKQPREIQDFLMGLQERFSKIPLPDAISWGKNLGLPEGMSRLLHQSTEELNKLFAAQKRLGNTTDEDFEAARRLENAWADLQQAATKLGNTILTQLNEPLLAALKAMTDWVIESKSWLPDEVLVGFNKFEAVLRRIVEAIRTVVEYMGGWENAAKIFFGLWVAAKLAPLLTFATTFAAMLWSAAGATLALNTRMAALAIPAWFATLLRLAPALLAGTGLLATGPAGGEDDEFSRAKNEEFKREHPESSSVGKWFRRQLGLENSFTPSADIAMSPERRGFLDALSMGESGGDYGAKNPSSSAHGRYQFIDSTDAEVSARTGLVANDPVSQDRKAWYLSESTYRKTTGRDLGADLKEGGHENQIASGLRGVWPSLPGGSQQNTTSQQWMTNMREGSERYRGSVKPNIPPTGPAFGPPLPPQSALDPGMRFALQSPSAASIDNSRSNTSSSETHIGNITINTQASDTDGIAKSIGASIRKFQYVPQGNYGLA